MSDIRDRALQLTYWLSIAFCICTVIWTQIVPLAEALSDGQLVYGEYGTNDFIEYWSAWHAYAAGLNPYDPYVMQATQRLVDPSIDVPLMMWNPPWILTLFSPILSLSFSTAAILWLIVNFLIYLIAVRLYSNDKDALLLSLLFAPFWHSMFVGQLGSFLALGAACIYRGITKGNAACLASGLVSLSLKPHLMIPIAMVVIWNLITTRLYTTLTKTCLLLSLITTSLLIIDFDCILHWYASISSQYASALVPHPKSWIGLSVISYLRSVAQTVNNTIQSIFTIVPFITGIFFICINLNIIRKVISLNDYVKFVFYSILLAPIAWLFDYTSTGPGILAVVKSNMKSKVDFQTRIILYLLMQAIIFLLLSRYTEIEHSSLILYVLFMLLLISGAQHASKT